MAIRVLLVSPEAGTTALLCDILQQFGIEVEFCTLPRTASSRLSDRMYQGLIVDLLLGDDGLKLLKSLHGLPLNSRLIGYAVLRDGEQKIPAFQAGANFVFGPALDKHIAWRTISAAYPLMSAASPRPSIVNLNDSPAVSR